jgi:hypothetical protein
MVQGDHGQGKRQRMAVRSGLGLAGLYIVEGSTVLLERIPPRPYTAANGIAAGTQERGLSRIMVDGVLRGFIRLPHALDAPAEVHSIVSFEAGATPLEHLWEPKYELDACVHRLVKATGLGLLPSRRERMNERLAQEAKEAAKVKRSAAQREAAQRRRERIAAERKATASRIVLGLESLRARQINFTEEEATAIDLALAAARSG